MHDLIVFFDEAFSKVSGQDGGSRTEVTRDGSSALGQERVAPAFERGGGLGGGAIGEWPSSPPKFRSRR
jgi:hypothetical protein